MDDPTGAITSATTRGFTGHEMVDDVSFVNMNGRIYDPRIGRFLSADPYVSDPLDTQSLNRYAYVYSNPLTLTDMTGYFSFKKFFHNVYRWINPIDYWSLHLYGEVLKKAPIVGQINSIIAGIACGVFTAGVAGPACYAASEAINAGVTTGSVKHALIVFNTDAILGYASFYGGPVGAAVAGGSVEKINGGSFAHGAWVGAASAAIGSVVGAATGGYTYSDPQYYVGLAVSAAAGGAVSVLGGGKFANGAITAAFSYVATNVAAHAAMEQTKSNFDYGQGFGDSPNRCTTICLLAGGSVPIKDAAGNQVGTYNHQGLSFGLAATAGAGVAWAGGTVAAVGGPGLISWAVRAVRAFFPPADTVTVGRYMSPEELTAMRTSGRVQESYNGGVTSVSYPPSVNTYRAGPAGDIYVEFDVPSSAVRNYGSSGVGKIYGPNSIPGRFYGVTEMPQATNIVVP